MRRPGLELGLIMLCAGCITADPPTPEMEACVTGPCPQSTGSEYVRTVLDNGAEAFWRAADRNCITVYESPMWPPAMGWDAARPSLQRALDSWERVARMCDASVCVRYGGPAPEDQEWGFQGRQNVNLVAFVTDVDVWEMVPDVREGQRNALAVTVTSAESNGAYVDADIVFNEALHVFTRRPAREAGVDVESVMLHELGHVLGFGHTAEGVDSVMTPSLSARGGVARTLGPVDINGLCETFSF